MHIHCMYSVHAADGKRGKACTSESRVGFGFASNWMKKWREFLSQSSGVVNAEPKKTQITFDTQLSTLYCIYYMNEF